MEQKDKLQFQHILVPNVSEILAHKSNKTK